MVNQKLRHELREGHTHLGSLIEALDHLYEDALLIQDPNISLHYCLDFFDLRRYLAWEMPVKKPVTAEVRGELPGRVSTLLLHRLPWPLVLLPWYYREFVTHVKSLVYRNPGLTTEREPWLAALRKKLKKEIDSESGIVSQLALLDGLQGDVLNKEIASLQGRMSRLLLDMSRHMNNANKAVAFIERFDYLKKNNRLRGLKHAPEQRDPLDFEEDFVYSFCRGFFRTRRSDPEKALVNETDCKAISMVHQLNLKQESTGQLYLLVSSAPIMREAVAFLNENGLADTGRSVQLRDANYWNLWFSIALRENGGDSMPSLASIREFRENFQPVLQELSGRYDRLIQAVSLPGRQFAGMGGNLSEEITLRTQELDKCIESIAQPIIDGRWLFAELADAFLPIAEEREFVGAITEIQELFERVRVAGPDLDSAKVQLVKTLQWTEALLERLENEARRRTRQIEWDGFGFLGGWHLDTGPLQEPFSELMITLEYGGVGSIQAVRDEIEDLPGDAGEGFEGPLIASRIALLEGQLDEARRIFDSIENRHYLDPNVQFLDAEILLLQRNFVEAERRLRVLCERFEDAAIRLMLSLLFIDKYQKSADPDDLEEAAGNAALAREKADHRSLRLRTEIALNYFRISFFFKEGLEDPEILAEGSRELTGLLKEWGNDGVPGDLKRMFYLIFGRVQAGVAFDS